MNIVAVTNLCSLNATYVVFTRDSHNDGPKQDVIFQKGRHYAFEGYMKIVNDIPDKIYQRYKVVIKSKKLYDGKCDDFL